MTFSERLNQLLINTSHEERFSGAVLIQRNDDTVFEAVYGYANRSWKVKNRVDTRFRIASISKMFTAVAVLRLIDEGLNVWIWEIRGFQRKQQFITC